LAVIHSFSEWPEKFNGRQERHSLAGKCCRCLWWKRLIFPFSS